MKELVETLAKTPLPTILVVAGIIFLFLAIGGQLGARFSTAQLKPVYASALGLILLATGIVLQVVQAKSGSSEKAADTAEKSENATQASPHGKNSAQKYALRIPAVKGRIIQTITRMEMPELAVSVEQGGKYTTGTESVSNQSKTRTEIMAAENGRPTVLRQAILSDSESSTIVLGDQPSNDAKKGPLEGAVVLIELKNGRWVKTLQGRQPDKTQKAELQKQFVNSDDIYPTEKISPGYRWELKDQQLVYFFPDALSVSGNAWCTFEGIESHLDQKCAAISSRIQITAKTLLNNNEAEISVGANAMIYRALDKFVDVEATIDGQMKLKSSSVIKDVRTIIEIGGSFHSASYDTGVTSQPDVGFIRYRDSRIAMFAPSAAPTFLNILRVAASVQSLSNRRHSLPP
jgi:hypothetical protein